jgi:hypothetical protein
MSTASDIIETLGGSAAVARETGFPLTTIESWKAANFIPEWRQQSLLDLALRLNKPLSTTDFPAKADRIRRQDAAA